MPSLFDDPEFLRRRLTTRTYRREWNNMLCGASQEPIASPSPRHKPDLPALPSGLKLTLYTADELDYEECRIRRSLDLHARRGARFTAIIDRYAAKGDALVTFKVVAALLAGPASTAIQRLTDLFLAEVECGAFPVCGTGFREHRQAVRALVDLYSVDAVPTFAAGRYPLRPSLLTIKWAPGEMRACCSVWVRWIRAHPDWRVPPALSCGLVVDHESASDEPPQLSPPAVPPTPSVKRQRGNTAYNDDAIVARASEIYLTLEKPSQKKAAELAVEEWIRDNPGVDIRTKTNSKEAWIERFYRKVKTRRRT
jgi:hypothetical protein